MKRMGNNKMEWKKTWFNRWKRSDGKTIHFVEVNPTAMEKDFGKRYKYILYTDENLDETWDYFLTKKEMMAKINMETIK